MMQNPKIKILFRHRSMEMGGVEKVMLSLLNNLNREKFEITVCLNLNQGELRNEFPNDVRKVYLADGKEDFSNNFLLQKIQLLKRKRTLSRYEKNPELIDKNILKENYDIEIGMTYNDFEMVLNSSNKKSKKIGWFHSEINIKGFEILVPKILEQFPKFDQMVYCSQRIHDLMHIHHSELKYPKEKVIINAIPIEEIRKKAETPAENLPEGKNFISIGRLHKRKGYHKLIEAHKKLIDEGVPHNIIIIGDGEEKENLLKLITENKVEKSFLLFGNRMNPYPYLKKADFFILPSQSEAWPLVIAEALLLHKPTIATNSGDVATMIKNEETGLIINYEVEEMYLAMKRFLTDENLVSKIKENLRSIDEKFDNSKIFREVEEMLIGILDENR